VQFQEAVRSSRTDAEITEFQLAARPRHFKGSRDRLGTTIFGSQSEDLLARSRHQRDQNEIILIQRLECGYETQTENRIEHYPD